MRAVNLGHVGAGLRARPRVAAFTDTGGDGAPPLRFVVTIEDRG